MALQNDREAKQNVVAQKQAVISKALEQRLKLMESISRDVEIASEAADQGLAEKYRTQAGNFLSKNTEAREKIDDQIEKLESIAQSELLSLPPMSVGSPVDGLASVFGGHHMAIIILCAWLALMFDALPIAGIMLLETRSNTKPDVHSEPLAMPYTELTFEPFEKPREVFASSSLRAHLLGVEDVHVGVGSEPEVPETKNEEQRVLTNIGSCAPELTKAFFIGILGFKVKYESDWYIQLCAPENSEAEFGILAHDHELMPETYRGTPQSVYLTIPVPDVDEIYEAAMALGVEIIQPPKNEFYGQRRMLVREPGGCLVDVCTPCEVLEEAYA